MPLTKKFVVLALLGFINFANATKMANQNYLSESEYTPMMLAEADLDEFALEDAEEEILTNIDNPWK